MRKVLFTIVLMLAGIMAYPQSKPLTVRGKTKAGKEIKVDYYKGTIVDYIENVEYEVVDDLQKSISDLQKQVRDLQNNLNKTKADLKQMTSNVETSDLMNEKNQTIDSLNDRIADMQRKYEMLSNDHRADSMLNVQMRQIANLENGSRKKTDSIRMLKEAMLYTGLYSPNIGVSVGVGPCNLSNGDAVLSADKGWSGYVSAYYGTKPLTEEFPLSFEFGIGFGRFSVKATRDWYEQMLVNVTDVDGDNCHQYFAFSDLKEKIVQSYLAIPVMACFGQPSKNKITAYFKLGIVPTFGFSPVFEGEGSYTSNGYYENWDILIEDVEQLGYVTDGECYKDVDVEVEKFSLWGTTSLGVYLPLSPKAKMGSRLVLKAGVRMDYCFSKLWKAGEGVEVGDYKLGCPNLPEKGKVLNHSLEIGIVYNLK